MNKILKKVMWIDDDVPIIESMKRFNWEQYFCSFVGSAKNGRDALNLLDALNPDFIFVDINMPILNGLDFVKEAKPRHPNIKYVIYSAYSDFHFAREAIRLGASDYIAKGELTDDEFGKFLLKLIGNTQEYSHEITCNDSQEKKRIRYEVQFVLDELKNHFMDQEVSLEHYAKLLNMSTNYLGAIFYKESGMKFKDYLSKLRIERAYQLLKYTPLRVYEVAEQVGIRNVQYFNSLFSKYYGVSPRQVK